MSPPAATSKATDGNASVSAGVDPTALMRIKSLQLRAKTVVDGFFSGLHRSPTHGSSIEFSEYRAYVPGDDLRNLDWKLYARSDRYFVKKFEDETNRRCYLLVDLSRSMGYGSLEYSKLQYARTVAATLAYFIIMQHDAVGVLSFDDELGDFLPAKSGAKHFHQILVELSKATGGTGTDLEKPLEQVTTLVPRRGLVVLISDLLADTEVLRQQLAAMKARDHEVVILRTLDPRELDFELEQSASYVDMENNAGFFIDPQTVKDNYLARFREHQQQVELICKDLGIGFHTLPTDQPLDSALAELINTRNKVAGPRRRSARRTRGGQ